jgi:phosphomannomutase
MLRLVVGTPLPFKRGKFVDFRTGMWYFSPTGGNVTREERLRFASFDEQHGVRRRLVASLKDELGDAFDLDVKMGGQIGSAVHPRGWDKSLVLQHLPLARFENKIHFFGDRCDPTGNDYPLYCRDGIHGYAVSGPTHTLELLRQFV